MRNELVVTFLFATTLCCAGNRTSVDIYNESFSFGGDCVKSGHCADIGLFSDSVNNRIGNACTNGCSVSRLTRLGIADLDSRLQKLVDANTLIVRDGKYYLGFPALTGEKRRKVAAIVKRTADRLAPRVAVMVDQLRVALPGHEDMAFHLLWSRVVDEIWCQAWQLEHRPGNCPPGVEWLIYPHHKFSVGTNYWASDVAVTWARHSLCKSQIVLDSRLALRKAAWGQKYADENIPALQRLGLLDDRAQFQGFAYHVDDPLDKLLNQLTKNYAALVAGAYDYNRLSRFSGISSQELFVILLHETAYALFENLSRLGKLQLPSVLNGIGETAGCRSVSSFLLNQPVSPRDEIEYLFQKSGWRGDQKTIDTCRKALKNDPDDTEVQRYLGLSLYQMGEYRESLQVFRKLSDSTTGTPDLQQNAVSHLWMGHLYDMLGERENAVNEYQEALHSGGANTPINYDGYGIPATTVRQWAEERIKTPYVRR
jgi:tetratricopeptide (TPR) repeat protein